ncbi:MAG: hypothetical protein PGN16_03020 [Sphingomonas phyllosphaerae]|uniref:hypothetical protein n=1 Tax=Sphingomonas phyllosphaerae TaxID=257003 RepID=UPI002FF4C5E5
MSNAASAALTVWIEPCCDELPLSMAPPIWRSWTIVFSCRLRHPGTLTIPIDGLVQDTGGRSIDLPPELCEAPVRAFVNVAYRN